jgi:hypothetical protein
MTENVFISLELSAEQGRLCRIELVMGGYLLSPYFAFIFTLYTYTQIEIREKVF